jgi:hypothetical protein
MFYIRKARVAQIAGSTKKMQATNKMYIHIYSSLASCWQIGFCQLHVYCIYIYKHINQSVYCSPAFDKRVSSAGIRMCNAVWSKEEEWGDGIRISGMNFPNEVHAIKNMFLWKTLSAEFLCPESFQIFVLYAVHSHRLRMCRGDDGNSGLST